VSSQKKIIKAIVELDEQVALELAEQMIESGIAPMEILEQCRKGMSQVGEKFENGDFFLSEMIMAAEIFNQVMDNIRPQLVKKNQKPKGKIVFGTVEGDVHDIGKNIVIALLEVEGFEVIDLGVDVPPSMFVDAIKKHEPEIVCMSSLLTVALESTKKTIEAITEAGLRDKLKIAVGGGRIDDYAAEYIQPDAYSDNAAQGVRLILELLGK
jgi:methanogenic corrinoid protein MtbC1